jgi:hypothetical protein
VQSIKILKKSVLLTVLGIASLTACSNQAQKSEQSNEKSPAEAAINSTKQEQSNPLLSQYLAIKTALVESDFEKTKKLAAEKMDNKNLSEKVLKAIASPLKMISEAKDIAGQREHFKTLSEKVYEIAQKNKLSENTLYRQFCPMAFGGEGGYWLSSNEEIMNPYFGDRMLHCGVVKEEL